MCYSHLWYSIVQSACRGANLYCAVHRNEWLYVSAELLSSDSIVKGEIIDSSVYLCRSSCALILEQRRMRIMRKLSLPTGVKSQNYRPFLLVIIAL
jgi:hypothetical protein